MTAQVTVPCAKGLVSEVSHAREVKPTAILSKTHLPAPTCRYLACTCLHVRTAVLKYRLDNNEEYLVGGSPTGTRSVPYKRMSAAMRTEYVSRPAPTSSVPCTGARARCSHLLGLQ